MKSVLRLLLLASIGCNSLGALPEPVDLGYGYDSKTIVFPGGEPFNYRKMFAGESPNGVWYSANDFATAEHCGTHLDAPYHFNKNGRKVADIPLDRLMTKAILVDAVKETGDNASYALPSSKLEEWEKKNGEIPDKSVLLVRFGWSSKYQDKEKYLGPSDGDLRFPGLSEEAARWIVNSKKICTMSGGGSIYFLYHSSTGHRTGSARKFAGVGVDTPSLDVAYREDYPVHKLIMANDIYGLENVNLAFDLPDQFNIIIVGVGVDSPSVDVAKAIGVHVHLAAADIYNLENVNLTAHLPSAFNVIVMPMKLANGTGAPTRIIAL